MRRTDITEVAGIRRTLWAASAALPVVAHGAFVLVNVEPGAWLQMPARLRWQLPTDTMLYTTACAVIAGPLAGVAIAATQRLTPDQHARRRLARIAGALVAAAAIFAGVSYVLNLGWSIGLPGAAADLLAPHLTLLTVTLAIMSMGALLGTYLADPLDAAAIGIAGTLMASFGVLVGGAAVADLPRRVIAAALTASPVVAVASAARIDLVRMDILYQISPLAHMQIDYPSWPVSTMSYLLAAGLCLLGVTLKGSGRAIVSTTLS